MNSKLKLSQMDQAGEVVDIRAAALEEFATLMDAKGGRMVSPAWVAEYAREQKGLTPAAKVQGAAPTDLVTRKSALKALNYLDCDNAPGRYAKARQMLFAALAAPVEPLWGASAAITPEYKAEQQAKNAAVRARLEGLASGESSERAPADKAKVGAWWIAELENLFVAPISSPITADMKRAANIGLKVARGERWNDVSQTWELPKTAEGSIGDDPEFRKLVFAWVNSNPGKEAGAKFDEVITYIDSRNVASAPAKMTDKQKGEVE